MNFLRISLNLTLFYTKRLFLLQLELQRHSTGLFEHALEVPLRLAEIMHDEIPT